MENDRQHKRARRPCKDAPHVGVVRVFSRPGPDAEDRLRRLMSLMIKYATQDGQTGREHDRLRDEPDEGAEAEA